MTKKIRTFLVMLVVTCGLCLSATNHAMAEEHKKEGAGDEEITREYYEMSPLMLPVVGDKGIIQQVSIVISLELEEDLTRDDIRPYQPRLADAFIQDLYGVLGSGFGMIRGTDVIDVRLVKKRLSTITEHVVGPEKVHDVLLQVVAQRPM